MTSWICCQLGAREHFAVPRALHALNLLDSLVTDVWAPPSSLLAKINGHRSAVRDRFQSELRDARVISFNSSLILFEVLAKASRLRGWPLIMARNKWFQRKVVACLSSSRLSDSGSQVTLFAYGYAAGEIFRFAKLRGWKTVLGQIDPGPIEEDIVAAEVEREPWLNSQTERAPMQYWENWREECAIADHIVVNSPWSFQCVCEAGVSPDKLHVVPLAFEAPGQPSGPKLYPERFTSLRPLRVLFLGQVNPRKGIARLLKAANALQNDPIEFTIVGPVQIRIPPDTARNPRIHWLGSISRGRAHSFYEQADILILPTLSDGFALTQLEAFANRLPVIASKNCGKVIRHGVNGLLLDGITPGDIESALRFCLNNPARLAAFSEQAIVGKEFSLEKLGERLLSLPGQQL